MDQPARASRSGEGVGREGAVLRSGDLISLDAKLRDSTRGLQVAIRGKRLSETRSRINEEVDTASLAGARETLVSCSVFLFLMTRPSLVGIGDFI